MPPTQPATKILRPQQLVELYPAIKLRTLRYWIQHAEPRAVAQQGKRREIPGNGLAPALIRKGRITFIDEAAFCRWLEEGRRGSRLPEDDAGERSGAYSVP